MALSPWFALLFAVVRAFSVNGHPATDVGSHPDAPTCEELQELWELLTGTLSTGALTNEIPVMPVTQMDAVLGRFLAGSPSRRGKHHKLYRKYAKAAYSNRQDIVEPFAKDSWMVQPPISPSSFLLAKSEPVPEGNGYFGEFHELNPSAAEDLSGPPAHHLTGVTGFGPSSSSSSSRSSVPLGDMKNGEFYVPQWGSPEEVDTFGNFLDFDVEGSPPHLAITRTPKSTSGEWSYLHHSGVVTNQKSQAECDGLVNSDCTENEQCFCKGWKNLQCIRGRCLKYDRNSDLEKYGTWHDGPIPKVQLRLLAMPRKKSYKSIFM